MPPIRISIFIPHLVSVFLCVSVVSQIIGKRGVRLPSHNHLRLFKHILFARGEFAASGRVGLSLCQLDKEVGELAAGVGYTFVE